MIENNSLLGKYIDILSGFAFDSSHFTTGEGFPLIRIRDLEKETTEIKYNGFYRKEYIVKNGDLLIGMDGDFHTVLWKGKDALLNQRVCKVTSKNSDKLDQVFLFYWIIDEIKRINETVSATTVKHLSTKDVFNIEIEPLPIIEQKRIAEILSTTDETIEQTQALIDKYNRIKRGLMQDLLTRGIDENGNIRSKETHKFTVKNGIEVPDDWDVESFKDLCVLLRDGTHLPPKRVGEGVWLLGVSNIISGEWKLTSSDTKVPEEFYEQMHKFWQIEPSDVLLAIVGATIGKVTQVPISFPKFTLQRSVCILRGKSKVLSNDYLRLFIESPYFYRALWNEVNVTAQPGIYLDTIGKFLLPLPNYDEQLLIVKKLQKQNDLINNLKKSLSKLQAIKKGLMQDLLSGKVRVKIDE